MQDRGASGRCEFLSRYDLPHTVRAEVKGQEKGEVIQNSTISTNLELFTDDEQCKAGITRFTDLPRQLTGKGGFLNGILMWRLSLPRTCRSDGHGVAQRRAGDDQAKVTILRGHLPTDETHTESPNGCERD
jgi:hypothetical protein